MKLKLWLSWKLCGFFSALFQDRLIVKSDSMNVIMWVSSIDLKSLEVLGLLD